MGGDDPLDQTPGSEGFEVDGAEVAAAAEIARGVIGGATIVEGDGGDRGIVYA